MPARRCVDFGGLFLRHRAQGFLSPSVSQAQLSGELLRENQELKDKVRWSSTASRAPNATRLHFLLPTARSYKSYNSASMTTRRSARWDLGTPASVA